MSTAVCTEVTPQCPVSLTLYGYRPNAPVNGVLGVIFGICFLVQLGSVCFFRVRTWSYTTPLALGALIELIGYAGRLLMHHNPWGTLGIAMQLIALIVAPSFIAAAVSVTFKHIIMYCGPEHSMLRPRFVPLLMIGTDFIGIIIQFIGAGILAMAVTADVMDKDRVDLGDNIIIFGVAFQVFIMIVCGAYMVHYWLRVKKATAVLAKRVEPQTYEMEAAAAPGYEMPPVSAHEEHKRAGESKVVIKFRQFCWAIVFSFVTIFVRCVYR